MANSINKENLELINRFKLNKNKQCFSEILNMLTYFDNRPKCKICGDDIYYDRTELLGARQKQIYLHNTSYETFKIINGEKYYLCVCEDCMRKQFPEYDTLNVSKIFNRPSKYVQFAFNIPDEVLHVKLYELCARTEESFIKKYGEELGTKKWNEYCRKQSYTNTFEYKNKKYGMTKEEFDLYNKSRAVTLENLIQRYGEDEGLKHWENYKFKQAYTNTLEYFINEYGEKDGHKKYSNMIQNKNFGQVSPISQKLFKQIAMFDIFKNDEIFYNDLNREYCFISKEQKFLYYIDFYNKTKNIVIEFNGDLFHANPTIYNNGDAIYMNPFSHQKCLVKDIWNKDNIRYKNLKQYFNIDTIVVWEHNYKTNEKATLEEIERQINDIILNRKNK